MKNVKPDLSNLWTFALIFLLLLLAACSPTDEPDVAMPAAEDETMSEMDHDMEDVDHNMADMDHDSSTAKTMVPNDGASIRIVSPDDGATFQAADAIPITVETQNFVIGEEGKHWHIYLDGAAIMVMGGNNFVLQNLAPGEHEIQVRMSLGSHEDLMEGDAISIFVKE